MFKIVLLAAVSAGLLSSAAAQAQSRAAERPALLNSLTECRRISDHAARLSCFDQAAAAIDEAESRRDLVVVDRNQLSKTRRTLFGLTLPNLSIFGDDSPDAEGVQRIESTIQKVAQSPYGKWLLTLEDGATWEQTDSRNLPITPKVGHNIKIRKAAMGSYLANVKDQVAIRVRRMR